jgi:NAD(P)-dependent dehydrogenase (short-subunit alcohol dehydrogenase family)
MKQRFLNKIVLVIGGNSGIGLASAHAFAREGARVAITGRNPETLASAAQTIGPGTLAIQSDVTDLGRHSEVIQAMGEHFGRLDVLFVNAGGGGSAPIEAVTPEEWDATFAVNLKGMYFIIQKALPLMGAGASIVLTSSLAARKTLPHLSVYSAAKAGVSSLGRTLGAELIARGIRVNVVTPGPIATPLLKRTPGVSAAQAQLIKEHVAQTNPMKRWGTPEEAARVVLFLASDEASFVTGTDTLIDGGAGAF